MPRRNQIAAWREVRGLTQEELAAAIGVTHATISRIETGIIGLKESRLYAIADALKVAPGVLLAASPDGVDADGDHGVLALWHRATSEQKEQITRVIRALLGN